MEVANPLSPLSLEQTEAMLNFPGRHTPTEGDNAELELALEEASAEAALSGEVGPDTGVSTEPRELSRPEYKSDDFRMFRLKIELCSNPNPHCYTDCPFSHPNEKARRRDPTKIQYDATACPHFRKGQCQFGNACPCAHGVFELWLHPSKYKTELCSRPREAGKECEHPTCFFAHHESEQRRVSSVVSPTGPPLMSPSGSVQSSPSDREDILNNNEVMAAALHKAAATLVQQQRSASISASPFADPNRLGSLPFDDFNARSFITGGPPLLTQRSPSMDAAPSFRRPMQFSTGYNNAPRHLSDAVAMSRAPSAPVIPRHVLSQQLGGSLPPLDLQHGRSLEPSINRALLQKSHAAYTHTPLPTHMAPGPAPAWMSSSGGASLPHNMDLARLLGQMTISNAMQKGLSGHLDPSMVNNYSSLAGPTPNSLHGLAVSSSDLQGLHASGLASPLDRFVSSSFLSDTLDPTMHLQAGPQAYYLNHN
eukprot:jgi/Botrbrau1/15568/Bobra.0274s0010.1